MELHYQRSGNGTPLLILHGLFGTWDNWRGQIKLLAQHFDVIAVDLRNHGASPHSEAHDYSLMAADVVELMTHLQIESAHILGHSMGGKVAMQLALEHPQRVQRLIIVDIAPVEYERHHDQVFEGLFSLDPAQLKSRGEADKKLAEHVHDPSVRAFLLKNLYRTESGQFDWRMNLKTLHAQYPQISAAPSASGQFQGPALFIKGGDSDYLLAEYEPAIRARFPAAQYKIMAGCGHWPHAEKPTVFNRLVERFLTD